MDLSSTERWRSRGYDPSHFLADAQAIPGYTHLIRPGAATMLLLTARGMVTRRGRITEKVRSRVSAALQHEPDAWEIAESRAPAVGMTGALRLLRRAYEAEGQLSLPARAAGIGGVWLHAGPARAKAKVFADARPRHLRPAVVSFSGLDGSGKSTQVTELRDALARLGVSADVQWAGFKTGGTLRGALPFLDRSFATRRRARQPGTHTRGRDPLVPAACRDSAVGRHLWMYVVVGFNTVSLWRYVLMPRRGARVLVFDRFSPDSAVKLDLHYRCNRQFDIRWHRAVFAAISPKPDVGFLVAVPSEVAYTRRQDQTPDELKLMTRLYDEQAARFRLVRLDGTEPPDSLSHQVVRMAWRGLR